MNDGKDDGFRRHEPSNDSRGSKLPRLGQAQTAGSDSKPGHRKNPKPNSPTHNIKITSNREHKREQDSGSSSVTSQESNDLPIPRTPTRTISTPASKARTPRVICDLHNPHSYTGSPSSSHKDSISAARAVLPGPNTTSNIPRSLISKTSPSRHVFKRKDSKAKDVPKMENEKVKVKETPETQSVEDLGKDVANGDTETHIGNGNGSTKENQDFPSLDKSVISTEEGYETPTNGLESTEHDGVSNGASYASALKSDLNGQEVDVSSPGLRSNSQDDDESYPELDDLTLGDYHPPPKPNTDGRIRWAPWNVPLKRRLQTLVVLMHCMCIVLTVSIFFALCANPFAWPLLLIYLLHVLSSKAATDGSLKYRSEWFRKSYMWHLFAGYFPAKLHKTHDLPPTRKYIFGYHPHGIISHGAWAAFATDALGFSEKFPGITNSLLTLDSNFRIPLYREYVLAAGVRSVSKESIVNILTKGGPNGEGMGRGVTIVIGGARESLEAQPGQMRLILKERKGFIKIAVRTGADVVPVLAFGENNLYDQLHPREHPLVHRLQMFVLKVWKFTLPFLHGRGIFNYDVGLMPYRRPLNVVVGAPIKVTQAAVVDQAEINRLHDLYVAELEKLWDRYKDDFAPDRREEMQILS